MDDPREIPERWMWTLADLAAMADDARAKGIDPATVKLQVFKADKDSGAVGPVAARVAVWNQGKNDEYLALDLIPFARS